MLAGVNTSESKAKPSGNLAVIDLATKTIEATCDLGGQPDSVALSADKSFLAIAIENERDEEVNDGAIPQMPSGNLKIVPIAAGVPDCARHQDGRTDRPRRRRAGRRRSRNSSTSTAWTRSSSRCRKTTTSPSSTARPARSSRNFSAGAVTLDKIDTKKDGALAFTGKMEDVLREPDAVKWLDDNRFVVANEGDYEGGSRGFTIFSKTGEVLYESGAVLRIRSRQCSATIRKPATRRASSRKASKPAPSAKTS